MNYGNWADFTPELAKWFLFAASIVCAVDVTVSFAMKALDR